MSGIERDCLTSCSASKLDGTWILSVGVRPWRVRNVAPQCSNWRQRSIVLLKRGQLAERGWRGTEEDLLQILLDAGLDGNAERARHEPSNGRGEILHQLGRLEHRTAVPRLHRPPLRTSAVQIDSVNIREYHFRRGDVLVQVVRRELPDQRSVPAVRRELYLARLLALAERIGQDHRREAQIDAVLPNECAELNSGTEKS